MARLALRAAWRDLALIARVFVKRGLQIDMSFDAACGALEYAIRDGGLVAESRKAVDDGLVFLMPVGPLGTRGPVKEVLVRLLPMRRAEGRATVPMRWEVARSGERVFPSLDADLELFETGPGESKLSIIGRYEPPLGRWGATLDRVVMSKVATATMTALLKEISAQLLYWSGL